MCNRDQRRDPLKGSLRFVPFSKIISWGLGAWEFGLSDFRNLLGGSWDLVSKVIRT